MHFCNQFARGLPLAVKELGDIFLESVLAAERYDKKKAAYFDSPPLKRFSPALVASITSLLVDFKKGILGEPAVLKLIQIEVNPN
jgi:hypothetical protein